MEFRVPELGEGIYEAELVEWTIAPGDVVQHGQSLAEVMTDKATMELPAPFAGTIDELRISPGEKFQIGQVALTYTTSDVATAGEIAEAPQRQADEQISSAASLGTVSVRPTSAARSPGGNGPIRSVRAAPSVRRMARSLGIDLAKVRGSGQGGRILIDDLTALVNLGEAQSSTPRPPAAAPLPVGRPGERIKVVGLRRVIAEHMLTAKRSIPHYSYVDECDVTRLVQLRDSLKDVMSSRGIKLTYLAFVVKAVVQALKKVPIVNASLEDELGEIVLHDCYHVGIATATAKGLMVPVIHHADRYTVAGLAGEIQRLGNAARADKLRVEELRGGTFTVSSVGSVGGLISTPIINHPEVGILGLGKVVKKPVYSENGFIVPADLIYLSFSFDHRVVDGAVGAIFGNAVKDQLSNPGALLIDEPRD
jgi:pyruvate dehydrogenase E2 component (dihydrolipoamide acetyltransferase)/2-oxoisovalerate dehydrogenase E2 component (dihydrolipoyl transacylase)